MIHYVLVGHAPVDVIVYAHAVTGPFADIVIAETLVAGRLAAAVVIADEVGLVVLGMLAGADPGHLRDLRSRRTGVQRTAATGAKEPVQRAVAPIFARGIALIARCRKGVPAGPIEWQHRQHRPSCQQRADP